MKKLTGRLLLAVVTVAFVFACAATQNRWEAAKSADTIDAYEEFLRENPEGDLADQARVRRNELQEESDSRFFPKATDSPIVNTEKLPKRYQRGVFMDEALEKLRFEQAITAGTIAAYEDFLKHYPAGRLADDARQRMEKLSFEQAQAEGTLSSYDGYLNRYPHGLFADEARLRREKLNAVSPASGWGVIMYPKTNANIRAKRSTVSKLKGRLKTDQPVKVDFLQDAWYAVFPVTQKERNEKKALGYVYAPLLIERQGPNSSGATASEKKSALVAPLKHRETEHPSVEVKSITFKVAGKGKEMLFIEFDRFYTPVISGIEGNEPRIVLEIKNASSLREDWATIDTGGNFIRQIRSRIDAQTHAALIVLDMVPEKSYFISQAFYKKENLYSLEISEKKEGPLP